MRSALASTDPVAADAVGAQLLGFQAQAVRHIWEAGKLGLGESDTDKLTFPALNLKQAFEVFTKAAYGRAFSLDHP